MDTLLFRYRDLVSPTLTEHRTVIAKKGHCWWGWWKRPSEEVSSELWEAFQSELETEAQAVFLFDSGHGTIHKATVVRAVSPAAGAFSDAESIDAPERDFVPAYYRNSATSRAWLKITAIDENPTEFFGKHSYARPPALRNHSASQLRLLTGKLVVDADELRWMDTTIWSVRQAKPGDRSERFIGARANPHRPLNRDPVRCEGEWILHLTDLHYATGIHRAQHAWPLPGEGAANSNTLVDAISSSLRTQQRNIGAVIVTGDLTFLASEQEFDAASRALFSLVNGNLSISMEQLLVIPGNHDMEWTRKTSYEESSKVELAPDQARANYENFYRSLFLGDPNSDLSMSRRWVFPGGVVVDVVGVNSCSLEQGKDFLAGMGRVQELAYREAANEMEWRNTSAGGFRFLALHHHVAQTEDVESPAEYSHGFGTAIDAPLILRNAARDHAHFILHGHKHQPFVWRAHPSELPQKSLDTSRELRSINILGGGSAGSSSVEAHCNYFSLIKPCSDRLELEIFQSKKQGEFKIFASFNSYLETNSDYTRSIGAWKRV